MTNTNTQDTGRAIPWRIIGWSIPPLVLLLPLVANAPWTLFDYVVVGVMLGCAGLLVELVVRLSRSLAYRAGAFVAVAAIFLLIWVNGAVGFLGDEDNPANLMFGGVILVAVVGSVFLGFQPRGMARAMFAAAARDGVGMVLASGYRSYATQAATYNGYVAARGQADADTASARPGYSEHQTGWAFDIADGGGVCSFQPCFADQPAAAWARTKGHRFGFVVRYPWMFHHITGYFYEPWHLRYIGVEAATDMANRGINTVEEYFGVEAAPGYP